MASTPPASDRVWQELDSASSAVVRIKQIRRRSKVGVARP